MKRYDLYSQDDQGNFEYANYPIPEEDGQWVDADIAQELYNALKFFQDIDSVDDLMIFEDMVDRILAKADED